MGRGTTVRRAACAALMTLGIAAAPASAAPAFGVSDGPYYGADVANAIDHIGQLGAGVVRVNMDWSVIQPSKGTFNWSSYDDFMAALAARGARPLLLVQNSPGWSHALTDLCGVGTTCPPSAGNAAAFGTFVRAVLERYATGSRNTSPVGVEVWNEPNLVTNWNTVLGPDPARYTALLKAAADATRAVAPGLPVILGALSPTGPAWRTIPPDTFLEQVYALGGRSSFDDIGVHDYPEAAPTETLDSAKARFVAALDPIRATRDANGDQAKNFWITEVGVADPANVPLDQTQGSTLSGLYDAAAGLPDVQAFLVYRLRNVSSQMMFGLIDPDWTPRASFAELAARFGPLPPPPPPPDPGPTPDPVPPPPSAPAPSGLGGLLGGLLGGGSSPAPGAPASSGGLGGLLGGLLGGGSSSAATATGSSNPIASLLNALKPKPAAKKRSKAKRSRRMDLSAIKLVFGPGWARARAHPAKP